MPTGLCSLFLAKSVRQSKNTKEKTFFRYILPTTGTIFISIVWLVESNLFFYIISCTTVCFCLKCRQQIDINEPKKAPFLSLWHEAPRLARFCRPESQWVKPKQISLIAAAPVCCVGGGEALKRRFFAVARTLLFQVSGYQLSMLWRWDV